MFLHDTTSYMEVSEQYFLFTKILAHVLVHDIINNYYLFMKTKKLLSIQNYH